MPLSVLKLMGPVDPTKESGDTGRKRIPNSNPRASTFHRDGGLRLKRSSHYCRRKSCQRTRTSTKFPRTR